MSTALSRGGATAFGFLSILLWGTSIAIGRLVMEEVGLLRGPMIMALASGSLATAGIVLAFLSRPSGMAGVTLRGILADSMAAPEVYLLGLVCGVSWGMCSNLGRKIAGANTANPVPVLFLVAGIVFLALSLLRAFPAVEAGRAAARWSPAGVAILAYRALVVDLLAYVLWDAAMRRGDQLLVAVASFCTPLLSTACVSLVLGVRPGGLFWIACLLLAAGAALSRVSVGSD